MHELIRRPFHVVNLTLNLVGGQAAGVAAAQSAVVHRDAAPLRQLLPGVPALGAVRRAGFRSGTAMTISGRGGQSEYGLPLVAGHRLHHDAAERAPRRLARQSRAGRRKDVEARPDRSRRSGRCSRRRSA